MSHLVAVAFGCSIEFTVKRHAENAGTKIDSNSRAVYERVSAVGAPQKRSKQSQAWERPTPRYVRFFALFNFPLAAQVHRETEPKP